MKRIIGTLFALAMIQSAPATAQNAEQEILALSKTKWRWMSERKLDSLAALFDDQAVFVHMSRTLSKSQELDVIRTGDIHYKHAEIFETSVQFIGTTAIVLNRIRLDAVVRGNEVTNPFTVTEVYVKQNGAWKLGALSFTRLLTQAAQQPQWVLPAGFQVTVFADSVENAREMALGPQGTVFVGSFRAGKVHAVVDRNGDHKADRVVLIASGLEQPNGVAIRNGALYVATRSKLLRFDDIERRLDSPPAPVVVRDSLPNSTDGHTWKFIAFGPDSLLYMSIGAPCNVCLSPPMVSTIVRMKPDGSNLEVFAEGVRNSVGFDWHPASRELWFTDNGRDMMGDDLPSDELNVAWKPGLHFGFPFCHQGDVSDPVFGAQRACPTTEPPVQKLDAHVAALGFTFYTGDMFPTSYKNAVIIAQHGSWNRSVPSGYRVMVARTDGRRVTSYETFLDGGFLPGRASAPGGREAGRAALGRPVDILQMPDGAILISDDTGNRILRVSYAR